MATITSAQSGNWSATSTWVGGVVPVAADTAIAATGHVVALDVDVTCVQVQQAGTGKFTLGNGRTLTAAVQANAGTFTSGGTVEVTATTTATITGAITGVSTTTNSIAAVVVTGTGTLTINGNVTGSAGNGTADGAMVYTNVNSSITVNGQVTVGSGNFKHGIMCGASAAGTMTVSNSGGTAISAAGGANALGFYALANVTLNVTGALVGSSSGTGAAYAVNLTGTSPVATINGTVTNNGGYQNYTVNATGASANITINGNVAGGSSGTGPVAVVMTGNSAVLAITGNITGPSSAQTVNMNGTGPTLTVTGNVTGGGGGHAVTLSGGSANITGIVTGGSGSGIYGITNSGASGSITVTGTAIGGAGSGAFGVNASGANATVTIVGTATGVSTLSHGVRCDATANGVIFTGNLNDSLNGAVAVYARVFRISATNDGTTTYTNTVGYPSGTPVQRISPNLTTGMPSAANVRFGTTFGVGGALTGTLRVPPANSVASGVLVDNTTGTAALAPADVAALVGAQIAAALTSVP